MKVLSAIFGALFGIGLYFIYSLNNGVYLNSNEKNYKSRNEIAALLMAAKNYKDKPSPNLIILNADMKIFPHIIKSNISLYYSINDKDIIMIGNNKLMWLHNNQQTPIWDCFISGKLIENPLSCN